MTDVKIIPMVKCPMLFEHEPCDLIPARDCKTCSYLRMKFDHVVDCKWGEPK